MRRKLGRERISGFLDTSGTGAWIQGPSHLSPANRAYGSSVNYDTGNYHATMDVLERRAPAAE